MIKCSKITLKYSNTNKKNNLHTFLSEYKSVVSTFISMLWKEEKAPRLIPKEQTKQINTWLSQRAIQCAGKQASAIVRGTKVKQKRRQFVYEKFISGGKHKKARKLKKIIDKNTVSKPSLNSLEAELDSRFVFVDWNNPTSFDGWLILSSLGYKFKIEFPLKRTKHFNMLSQRGTVKAGVRLSEQMVTFNFDIPDSEKKTIGATLGVDIGSKNVISCSNGFQSTEDKHGWSLDKIQSKMSRRRKGSGGFRKCQEHRKNYINWSLNQLSTDDIQKIRIENIKHLRRGRKSSRYLSHWTYTAIFDKLEDICSTTGVQLEQVNPTYTSQRCSQCGWVRKSNRQGSRFKCKSCSYEDDADLNASKNIALELSYVSKTQRLSKMNRTGFYWF